MDTETESKQSQSSSTCGPSAVILCMAVPKPFPTGLKKVWTLKTGVSAVFSLFNGRRQNPAADCRALQDFRAVQDFHSSGVPENKEKICVNIFPRFCPHQHISHILSQWADLFRRKRIRKLSVSSFAQDFAPMNIQRWPKKRRLGCVN